MLETFNLTNTDYDLARFAGPEALDEYCQKYHLDGVELMPYGENSAGYIPARRVVGVHLGFFPCWVDFWRGDEAGVVREYGSLAEARAFFGGDSPAALVRFFRGQLEFAQSLRAKYVVFHVSDVSLRESLTYRFIHTDEQVAEASAQLISAALGDREWEFEFLVENQWWPGLTMTRPEITRQVVESIPGRKKGVMLDTGHLLHTNLDLTTQQEAVSYIHRTLDAHPGVEGFIRGMHLQCALTGDFVRAMLASDIRLEGTYREKTGSAFEYILKIDPHGPFDTPLVQTLLSRIRPAYLTHEFITWDLEQATGFLLRQKAAMGERIGE